MSFLESISLKLVFWWNQNVSTTAYLLLDDFIRNSNKSFSFVGRYTWLCVQKWPWVVLRGSHVATAEGAADKASTFLPTSTLLAKQAFYLSGSSNWSLSHRDPIPGEHKQGKQNDWSQPILFYWHLVLWIHPFLEWLFFAHCFKEFSS